MDYSIYTQDGFIWTLNGVEPEVIKGIFENPNARYINLGENILEQRGNIAIVAPILSETDTENLFDVFLNSGVVVPVQATDSLVDVTQHLNTNRNDFVRFGEAFINPSAPKRITKTGAIQQ